VLDKNDVLRAVKIAGIFTNSKAGEIEFSLDVEQKSLKIQSKAEEVGENQTIVSANIAGPEQTALFNPRYMLDGLQTVATSHCVLLMNSNSSPAVLRMVQGENNEEIVSFTYVIMPIKN